MELYEKAAQSIIFVWYNPCLSMVDKRFSMARKTNIEKDKRSWWLSHEAFLTIEALAKEQGVPSSAFLETISRQLAHERLSDEQRARIKHEAQRISRERTEAAHSANQA